MTSTALAIYTPAEQVQLASDVWPLANRLSDTEFVPTKLRGRPEAVLACMLKGSELGIPLMQSLSAIHVIEGRPTMSAELMRAVVQSRGHTIVVEESSTTRCIIKGKRAGENEWQRFTFSEDDARRAGLLGKDVWKRWPAAMLLARASGMLCRAVFADCLAGISYTLEELGDGENTLPPDVAVVITPDTRPTPRKARARKQATRTTPVDDEPAPPALKPVPPLPGEDDITDAEVTKPKRTVDNDTPRPGPQQIAIALGKHGVTAKEDRRRAVVQIIGRDVTSSKELTPDEIALVLSIVNSLEDSAPFAFADTDPTQLDLGDADG
jgi:hypothetical protein